METEGTPARDDPDAEDLDKGSPDTPDTGDQLPEEGPSEAVPDDDGSG